MELHTLNAVLDEQPAPAFMRFQAVREKVEVAFDYARQTIGFLDTEPKAILVPGPRRGVPKLR
jgi:hypothetical protein